MNHFRYITLLVVVLSVGCKVSPNNIEAWKHTVKGPTKLVAVLRAEKYTPVLRAQAASALIEMERQDVDGLAELQQALQRMPQGGRTAVLDELAAKLESILAKGTANASADAETQKTTEIRAKDAAFLIVPLVSPAVKDRLVRAVVGWFVVDFNGRSLSGNYSAEQVIRGLGPGAAPMLIDALNPKMPSQALIKLSELIGQLGDSNAKSRAATRLIAIEKEMNSATYLDWLKGQVRDQLKSRNDGQAISEKRVEDIAQLNKENFINDGVIPSMKYMGDQEQIAQYLLGAAATSQNLDRRTRALQALEGKVNRSHLNKLLELALNPNNPPGVRDIAFDRVGDIGSSDALPRMWPLVADGKDARLRWRAGELILAIGGPAVISEFFSKLPTPNPKAADEGYPPEELEGYATRLSQMSPTPTNTVATQLNSSKWWNQTIALKFFERKGTSSDIEIIQKLTSDNAKPSGKGWEPNVTVGKLATRVIAAIKERSNEKTSR